MSIADIFKFQRQTMQDGKQFDQNAWKTAFDMANSFNKASDGFTQMQANRLMQHENELTSDARKAYMISDFGAKQAQNQNIMALAPYARQASQTQYQNTIDTAPFKTQADINQLQAKSTADLLSRYKNQGLLDWNTFFGSNIVDENGMVRNPEQMATLAWQNGMAQDNPYAMLQAIVPYQKYAQSTAESLSKISPEQAALHRLFSGQSPYTVSNDGTIKYFGSDEVIGQATPEQMPYVAAGTQSQQQKINQSAMVNERSKQEHYRKKLEDFLGDEGIMTLDLFQRLTKYMQGVHGPNDPVIQQMLYNTAMTYGLLPEQQGQSLHGQDINSIDDNAKIPLASTIYSNQSQTQEVAKPISTPQTFQYGVPNIQPNSKEQLFRYYIPPYK